MTTSAHKTGTPPHTGQRTLKMTGDASTVDVNAWEQHTYGCLDHVTLYPSPYMVLTEQGYTKHYYAGTDLCASREQSQARLSYAETKQSVRSNRVAARIGSGGLSYDATCVTGNGEVAKRSDELFWNGVKLQNEHKTKPEDFAGMSLVDARGKEVDWLKKIDLDKLAMSWQLEAKIDPGKIHFIIDDNSYPAMPGNTRYENEPDVYFYHSDHLGSASWITDYRGMAVQHIQYLPYGEPYVNQHPFGYSERFTFTGKERDEETGYGYFGARYMDHELMTMWLSVDPMADKYPNISPYAYCAWNPVKLVDPDGREISTHIDQDGNVVAVYDDGNLGVYMHSRQEIASVGSDGILSNDPDNFIGATLYAFSFREGDKIDVGSYQARDWMCQFEGSFSHSFANPIVALACYASEAGNGGRYDPKSYMKNGSQLTDGVYVSPRDLGNFAAGYFGHALGLSKERTLASFGAFQLAGNNKKEFIHHYLSYYKQALTTQGEDGVILGHKTYGEKGISNYFQRLGYENIRTIDDFNRKYADIWK